MKRIEAKPYAAILPSRGEADIMMRRARRLGKTPHEVQHLFASDLLGYARSVLRPRVQDEDVWAIVLVGLESVQWFDIAREYGV